MLLIKKIILLSLIALAFSSCPCQEDEFGETLRIEVPIDIGKEDSVFLVGDTLWLESNFTSDVPVVGSSGLIRLNNFEFFTSFYIADMQTTAFTFYVTPDFFLEEGSMELNQLGDGYDIFFKENENKYKFKAGVVLRTPGVFVATAFTDDARQRGYDHPALYTCKDNRRTNLFIDRVNKYSTLENMNYYNEQRIVVDQGVPQVFDDYRRTASFTFQVLE